jgi:hypothetical protein
MQPVSLTFVKLFAGSGFAHGSLHQTDRRIRPRVRLFGVRRVPTAR